MSRNCFPFTPFILLLAAVIAVGAMFAIRVNRKQFGDKGFNSLGGLLVSLLLLGIFSMGVFIIYSLANIYPC